MSAPADASRWLDASSDVEIPPEIRTALTNMAVADVKSADLKALVAAVHGDAQQVNTLVLASPVKPRTLQVICANLPADTAWSLNVYAHAKYEHALSLDPQIPAHFDYAILKNVELSSCVALVTLIIDTDAGAEEWWPIVVPFLLRYADSTDSAARVRGTRAVDLLASRYGARLARNGLVPLFEKLIEPLLHFLPPLSPPAETLACFRPALICLAKLASLGRAGAERNARLNFLAREGALNAFLHTADTHVELTCYYLDTLTLFIDEYLHELTIVHLLPITRVFSTLLLDPFITASPRLVDRACTMMSACVGYAWPRIHAYKYTILLALSKARVLSPEWCVRLDLSEAETAELLALSASAE